MEVKCKPKAVLLNSITYHLTKALITWYFSHHTYLNRQWNVSFCIDLPSCSWGPSGWSGRSAPSPSESRHPPRPLSEGRGRRPRAQKPGDRPQPTGPHIVSYSKENTVSMLIYIYKNNDTCYSTCCNSLLTFFGAAAFGHCMESMPPVDFPVLKHTQINDEPLIVKASVWCWSEACVTAVLPLGILPVPWHVGHVTLSRPVNST